jgi:4-diphosphocytidyl-2-C-methyl-D-erythritol kinase
MLVFPNCKINLGLHVVSKRPDGFHNIETVFYPVKWCDALEIIENNSDKKFDYSQSGLLIEGPLENNIIYKAWQIISKEKKIPSIKVHLHKNIPMGAGLGGGSSDAAFFINLLNDKFQLGYTTEEKEKIASQLGSDCAFFITNNPVIATGKGDQFQEPGRVKIDLSSYFILLVYPGIHSNTKEAYHGLTPGQPSNNLQSVIQKSVSDWKNLLVNDFESSIFKKYPEIKNLKEKLHAGGALYASMSGSGSAVFGIFEKEPEIEFPAHYRNYLQKPSNKIL